MEVVYPQLWIFDFDARSWSCVEAGDGSGSRTGGGGVGAGPPAVFDHTATRVGNQHIVVIGGAMVGTALNSEVCCAENLDMSSPTAMLSSFSNTGTLVVPASGPCCNACAAIFFALRLPLVGTGSVHAVDKLTVLAKNHLTILGSLGLCFRPVTSNSKKRYFSTKTLVPHPPA